MDQNHTDSYEPGTSEALLARRTSSHALQKLHRMTGLVYIAISRSILGRCARGYRRVDDALGGKQRRAVYCRRTVSRRRLLMAESAKNSVFFSAFRRAAHGLYHLPLRFYGLFALLYGVFSALFCYLAPLVLPSIVPTKLHLVVALTMGLISLPMMATSDSLSLSFSKSHFASVILWRYLCIPKEKPTANRRKMSVGLSFWAVLTAIGAAAGTLFVTPLVLPWTALLVTLCAIIFTYPEAGALLVTAGLPLVWLLPETMTLLVILIAITWVSYAFKLLQLRRSIHMDILDIVALLLFLLALIAGVGGAIIGSGNAVAAIKLLACLSVYWFVVHLLNTRTYIRRCLIGVGVTTVLVMLAGLFLRLEPIGIVREDPIRKLTERVGVSVFNKDSLYRSLLTVMTFPLLCSFLLRAKRLFSRFTSFLLLVLNLYLIVASSSVGTVLCTLAVSILLFLLLDHRVLTGGLLLLPGTVGGVGWFLSRLDPFSEASIETLSHEQFARELRMEEIWQTVYDHPLGMGIGVPCEGANLLLEILVSFGWQGLVVSVLFLILLLQKGVTALSHTILFTDRALVVGLICGVVGFVLRGITYGFLDEPRAILTLTLLAALLSALAGVLFNETDVREAEAMDSPEGVDRLFRHM